MGGHRISVIIPTLEAASYLPGLLTCLGSQSCPTDEILVIDSSSSDGTPQIARENGCRLHIIPRSEFQHGRTRNLGAQLAEGDILVFLTQDVLPADDSFLERLVQPILSGKAAAVTARQIPYPSANPIERLTRQFNYPLESNLRTWEDVERLGIKAVFFSNSASAIQRKTFLTIGRFSEQLIVDEDLELCTRLLKAGYTVSYQAEAIVYHSHNYSLAGLFRRLFDIGVFFYQAREVLAGIPVYNEGWKYVTEIAGALLHQKHSLWVPRFILESGIKYLAFKLGYRHNLFSPAINRRLSGQKNFWETKPDG